MPTLLCLLQGLLGLALVCLVLWVLWWAFTALVAAFGIAVPAQLFVILKVIAALVLVIIIVRAVLTGEVCGYFGWRLR